MSDVCSPDSYRAEIAKRVRAAEVFTSKFVTFARDRLGTGHEIPILRPCPDGIHRDILALEWGKNKSITIKIRIGLKETRPKVLRDYMEVGCTDVTDALDFIRELSEAMQGSRLGKVVLDEEEPEAN